MQGAQSCGSVFSGQGYDGVELSVPKHDEIRHVAHLKAEEGEHLAQLVEGNNP